MKKVSVILMMIGFALPSRAQLGFRTVWEKSIGNSFNSEFAIGKPFSRQASGGSIVFSIPYRPCSVKCSTTVMNRTILTDSTFKKDATYILTANPGYYPFRSNYYLQKGGYSDPQTNVFYYTASIYDAAGELKTEIKSKIALPRLGLFAPTSQGGFVYSLYKNGFNGPDSIVSINRSGQVNWKYALPSYELDLPDTSYRVISPDTPIYLDNQIAYISKREVRSKSNLSILISSVKHLVLVDSTGEKWKTEVDTTTATTQVIGQDAQSRLVVLALKDTVGLLSKFDLDGKKTGSLSLKLPTYFNESNLAFQSTPDNGFLLYRDNYPLTDVTKFGSNGQQEWQFSGYPFIERLKVYPNGTILGYTTYFGDYKLFLLAPNGSPIFSGGVTNLVEKPEGWVYFATADNLYAINPKGEVAWSMQRPASYAVVSLDRDGELLLTETISMPNPNAALFLKAFSLDFINTFRISKYSQEGKLRWQIPINLPVGNPNFQIRISGGAYPSKENKGEYLMTQLLITQNQNAAIGNLNNFSHDISITKITRPCYQNVEATLKTSTTTLCTGQKLQLTSNADSLNLLTYQWQRDGQSLSITRNPAFETTGAGTYRVTVRDSVCGTSFVSNAVNVVARAIQTPAITGSGSTDFCAGSNFATLTVTSTNPELSYQWVHNGQALSGTFQNSLKATEGGSYRLAALDPVCGATVLSNEIVVKVRPLPEAIVTPEISGAVYAPFKAKLRANEGAGLTYQWLKEGVELAGATNSVYEAGESGNYAVRVSREGCSQLSQSVGITILQPLGVETVRPDEFQVFPNPNRGDFEVRLPMGWEKAEIQMVDVIGRSFPMNRMGTHVRVEVTPGVYWLKVKLAGKELRKRVVMMPF